MLCLLYPTNRKANSEAGMDLLKEKRFWAALGLGLALCVLVPLGISTWSPGHESLWERSIWPWLSRALFSGIFLLAALVTGIRIHTRRPERLAAGVGFVAGGLMQNIFSAARTAVDMPGLGFLQRIFEVVHYLFSPNFGSWSMMLADNLTSLTYFALPLAVICWLTANYWRMNSWDEFRRGPGGAILKGGIIAGLIILPISFILVWYQQTMLLPQYIKQLPKTELNFSHHVHQFSWGWQLITGLRGIISGAMITAILTSLRPKPILGAFAGSGLVLGMAAFSFLLMRFSSTSFSLPPSFVGVYVMQILSRVLLGAIAGSFAGRWSDIEIAKEE
jgi:hypothetical protein